MTLLFLRLQKLPLDQPQTRRVAVPWNITNATPIALLVRSNLRQPLELHHVYGVAKPSLVGIAHHSQPSRFFLLVKQCPCFQM